MTNCQTVKKENFPFQIQEGWVGVSPDGTLYFKPDRGCNGYALYGTEANALRGTRQPKAIKVALKLHYVLHKV